MQDMTATPVAASPRRGARAAPTVRIIGVDPANKGACLMLLAATRELGRRFPGARFAVDIAAPVEMRLRYGLWGVLPTAWRGRVNVSRLMSAIPAGARHKLAILTDAEVDVVLDASGFAYGDFWGAAKFARRVGGPSLRWRAEGKTAVFLPQAWGPFSEPGFAPAVAAALNRADLVFARDDESARHLADAGVTSARLAPDFTNLISAAGIEAPPEAAGKAILIPNAKMLAARGESARGAYLAFMSAAAETLGRCADGVAILIHEGAGDRRLADALNASLPRPLPILEPQDELVAKAILAAAPAVISSRFHGLVSALSSGVPSMACGWTHKYEALMADYDSAAFAVALDDEAHWRAQLGGFTEAVAGGGLAQRVAAAAAAQKTRSRAMWDVVEATIRG
jgi:colanic acid/amylovoran biosynthesis protein